MKNSPPNTLNELSRQMTVLQTEMYRNLNNQIEQLITQYQQLSIFYLNLDHLALINETLGFEVGDRVLQEVTCCLQRIVVPPSLIAHITSDEFVVVLPQMNSIPCARNLAVDMLHELESLTLDKRALFISASIGIAAYPEQGECAVELLKNAMTAMHAAKNNGKNQYQFFVKKLSQDSHDALLIMNGLRRALSRQELCLEYQPIIELATMQCVGMEALMRWQHPELGLLLPEQFLTLAEEIGVSVELGQWVLQQACADYRQLSTKIPLLLCINMSATEFMIAELETTILATLQRTSIPIEYLIIELTEKIVMRDPEYVINKIKALANAGISIAIDDYGMGYSSLSLLKKLPTNLLKIDQSFIRDIDKKMPNAAIVESTIQLAHHLGMKVIAEGVESEEELIVLTQYACDYVQGFYFSKSLPLPELQRYLNVRADV
jgi:diguanylate cyclase (GGDEF)-like protein